MNDNVKTAVSCSLDILFLFFLPDGVFVCFSVIWGEKKKHKTKQRICLVCWSYCKNLKSGKILMLNWVCVLFVEIPTKNRNICIHSCMDFLNLIWSYQLLLKGYLTWLVVGLRNFASRHLCREVSLSHTVRRWSKNNASFKNEACTCNCGAFCCFLNVVNDAKNLTNLMWIYIKD